MLDRKKNLSIRREREVKIEQKRIHYSGQTRRKKIESDSRDYYERWREKFIEEGDNVKGFGKRSVVQL